MTIYCHNEMAQERSLAIHFWLTLHLHIFLICMFHSLRGILSLVKKILHWVLVHLQSIHKVLCIAPHAERMAFPELPFSGLDVACKFPRHLSRSPWYLFAPHICSREGSPLNTKESSQ